MRSLSRSAQVYILTMLALAVAAIGASATRPPTTSDQMLLTVVLTAVACLAQLFEVRTAKNKAYVVTLAFLLCAALLLPPLAVVVVTLAPFVVEQVRKPKAWYVQAFNAGSHILAVLAASLTAQVVFRTHGGQDYALPGPHRLALGGVLCAVVLLVVNHVTLAGALWLARGIRPRASGLFGVEGVLTDSCLLSVGVVLAVLWEAGHLLVAFAVIPLVLLQRALHVPALQEASRTDAKTGLYNPMHFREVTEVELRRSARTTAPCTVLMADLDLLRNINNAYGHLAGDQVLAGVANILREEVREYDVVARFGGEEFAILLPMTAAPEGLEIAERIRARVGAARFTVATSREPIAVTLSVGVATHPEHGDQVDALLHRADLAVYRAKVEGRDRVRFADAQDELTNRPAVAQGPSPLALFVGRSPAHDADVSSADTSLAAAQACAHASAAALSLAALDAELDADVALHDAGVSTDSAGKCAAAGDCAPPERSRFARATWPVTMSMVAAAVLSAALIAHRGRVDVSALFAFPLLAMAAELLGEDVYGSSAITVSAVAVLGAVAYGSPAAAVLAAVVSALVGAVAVRRTVEQALFNMANLALCATVAYDVRAAIHAGSSPAALPRLAPIMIAAAMAYFLIDNGAVSLVVSRAEGRPWWRVFRDDLAWLFPHFAAFGVLGTLLGVSFHSYGWLGLLLLLLPLGLVRLAQRQYLSRTRRQVSQLRGLATELQASHADVADANGRLATALDSVRAQHFATAKTLARAVDARDHTTGGHIERVCALGVALCETVDPVLAADPQVAFGFLLHDIGKIGVPDQVLLKPSPLTAAEREIMATHPGMGAALLADAGFAPIAREIALTHHERWDGGGYPQRLAGTAIPLASRLFAVVDALDAMTNDRPYRQGMPLEQAMEEIRRGAGTQFDPAIVEALLAMDDDVVQSCLYVPRGAAARRWAPQPSGPMPVALS